jgi:hypothetical protein
MGRYYHGDIEGKFWFGVQDSTDASHFGGKETMYSEKARYTFRKKDLRSIQSKIEEIQKELGDNYDKIEEFFVDKDSYSPKKLEEHLEVDEKRYQGIMELYARLLLGLKIEECVGRIGKCSFWAELY